MLGVTIYTVMLSVIMMNVLAPKVHIQHCIMVVKLSYTVFGKHLFALVTGACTIKLFTDVIYYAA